jgi:hypothetical protein
MIMKYRYLAISVLLLTAPGIVMHPVHAAAPGIQSSCHAAELRQLRAFGVS